MQKQNTDESKLKSFFKELGFLLSVVLAVILTAVDIVLGLFRYAWKRANGYPNFNPWQQICNLWIMIGRHIAYLFRLFNADFREQVRQQRTAMHRAASAFHGSMSNAKSELAEFDYVDAVVFFSYLPSLISFSFFLVQAAVALVTVISVYGVYKHYQVTAVQHTFPEAKTIVEYQPQVADKQEMDFGPWFNRGEVLERVNNPNFKNIALLSDTGGVKYSKNKTVIQAGFVLAPFNERVVNPHLTEDGQMTFTDQLGNEYWLNKEQGFMFEGYASKMFMFDASNRLTTIALGDAKTN